MDEETNDSWLNYNRKDVLTPLMIQNSQLNATPKPVFEGSVGAETETIAFVW